MARQIVQLHPFAGKIALGYGDWNDTKQPGCDLIAYDPAEQSVVSYGHYATDAFWSIRTVGDELWALMTDPEVGTNPDAVIVNAEGTTSLVSAAMLNPWHLFDAVWWKGQPWLAGSISISGSQDAQGVWTRYMTTAGERWKIAWQGPSGRAYALFLLNDMLHVLTSWGRMYRTIDGQSWTQLAGSFSSQATKPMSCGGDVVYRGYWPGTGTGTLYRNDGVRQTTLLTGVRDHFVDGDALWVLGADGTISRDNAPITNAPAGARSLCALDRAIYIGTSDSHLWRYA